MLIDVRANYAKTTCSGGCAKTDVRLAGNVVKMDPLTVGGGKDTLSAKHKSVASRILGERC